MSQEVDRPSSPILLLLLAAVIFSGGFAITRFFQVPFEKLVLFTLIPVCLNALPAFCAVALRRPLIPWWTIASVTIYAGTTIKGFLSPDQELIWSLSAALAPIVLMPHDGGRPKAVRRESIKLSTSSAANEKTQRGLDWLIATSGLIFGSISVMFPDANKPLFLTFAISMPAVFLPMRSRQGPTTTGENWASFWSVFEATRYACVAWAALMMGQQYLKVELIKAGSDPITEATISLSKAAQDGHRSDVQLTTINRVPSFTGGSSFFCSG